MTMCDGLQPLWKFIDLQDILLFLVKLFVWVLIIPFSPYGSFQCEAALDAGSAHPRRSVRSRRQRRRERLRGRRRCGRRRDGLARVSRPVARQPGRGRRAAGGVPGAVGADPPRQREERQDGDKGRFKISHQLGKSRALQCTL